MYKCKEHGQSDTDWCNVCEKLLLCDCKDIETQRIKDIRYGERDWTVTIYITYCTSCGAIKMIRRKGN